MSAVNGSTERAPARRTSLIADGALAAVLAVVLSVGTYFAAWHQHGDRAVRRRGHRPGHRVGRGAGAEAAVSGGDSGRGVRDDADLLRAGYASGPIWLALIIAYFTAAACGHRLAAVIAAVAVFAVFLWLGYLLRNGPAPSAGRAGRAVAAWPVVVLGAAEAVRIRRERAAEAARIREEEERRQASEERLRIARELHDSLGHYLSLISVQSGVALNLNPGAARAGRGRR